MTLFYMPSSTAFGQHVVKNAGAKLYFYEPGTTTPKKTYTTDAETVEHSDPVVADARGVFAPIFLTGNFKVALYDSEDVLIRTTDNVSNLLTNMDYKGDFDSSTNSGDYPATGNLGYLYRVSEASQLNAASGSHFVRIGDFIICNKNSATGVDADWDIQRTAEEYNTSGKRTISSLGTNQNLDFAPSGTGDTHATAGDIITDAGAISASTTVTGGTGVIATTGGVTATAGNIVATAGNITTTAGLITSATTITATLGDITATNGNLVFGTAGKGVDFSVNTPLAGMTSQLLDDYEEGTFTPAFNFATGGDSGTYVAGSKSGQYTKNGNMGVAEGSLELTGLGGGTGSVTITGLPFTISADSRYSPPVTLAFTKIGLVGSVVLASGNTGATTINLKTQSQSTANWADLDYTAMVATSRLYFRIFYHID